MSDPIYIVGHKNPDTDSVASAVAYARLKNILDPSNGYIPARCGNINNQTKYIFERSNEKLPVFLKDVYTKVEDIMTSEVLNVKDTDPAHTAFRLIQKGNIRVLPVVNSSRELRGIVGSPQLLRLFVQEDVDERPKYKFIAENIAPVLNGEIIHRGERPVFNAAILVGAMSFERSIERIDAEGSSQTVLIIGGREDVIKHAIEKNIAALIITGNSVPDFDYSGYKGWIFHSRIDSAETVRRVILATPVESIMSPVEVLSKSDYMDMVKDKILASDLRAMPVVDNGKLVGIVTRSNILKKHKTKLILVDHNEPHQAVDGIETADIIEIVDHHRLGTVKTTSPVTFYAKPVGSTCTLVYQLYKNNGVTPDKSTAMLLLSGILSDTVILKSPTATEEDRIALEELERIAGIDARRYGIDIFSATDNLTARTPESIISTDFKQYREHGIAFGVGQVEVVNLEELDSVKGSLFEELEKQKKSNGLNWAMLLVTDIIKGDSVLLSTKFEAGESHMVYRKAAEHVFSLPGVLSRKKQLLPEILRVLEEIS